MEGVDLTDLDNFAAGFPHELFARHRREAPVYWHAPTGHTPGGEGFWSVATHAEVQHVQREAALFSSERGGTLLQDLDVAGLVLNMMDDPRHGRIRRLVSTGLTPRTVRRLEDELRRRTRALLAPLADGGPEVVDVVEAVTGDLPTQAICILLGVPEDDRHELAAWFQAGFDVRDGDESFALGEVDEARSWMLGYAVDLVTAKRADPGDDMLSTVVHATLADEDPPTLTDAELWAFFSLLFAAGSDTTRNALSGGLLALTERPEQLADLRTHRAEVLPTALEEILRWTTPSPSKRRTATERAELGGHAVEPGDKVLFWEASANRDEAVFGPTAGEFDVRRDPNPHLALGHGVHYCLGANLARLELRVVLEELLDSFGAIAAAGPPEWTRSNRHTGIRHLPLELAR